MGTWAAEPSHSNTRLTRARWRRHVQRVHLGTAIPRWIADGVDLRHSQGHAMGATTDVGAVVNATFLIDLLGRTDRSDSVFRHIGRCEAVRDRAARRAARGLVWQCRFERQGYATDNSNRERVVRVYLAVS